MRAVKTTRAVVHGERPEDRVNREFKVSRPNALWVSDPRFHHSGAGSTWRHGAGSPTRTWPSMPSNRPFMSAVRPVKGSSITVTGLPVPLATLHRAPRAEGHCAFGAQRGRLPRSRHSGASSTTTPWPNPSSGCTRRSSSPGAARGVTAKQSSSPPSTGCTGTTTGACSSPSGMYLRLHSRHTTTTHCKGRRWLPDSSQSPSGIPGAVQMSHHYATLPLRSNRCRTDTIASGESPGTSSAARRKEAAGFSEKGGRRRRG